MASRIPRPFPAVRFGKGGKPLAADPTPRFNEPVSQPSLLVPYDATLHNLRGFQHESLIETTMALERGERTALIVHNGRNEIRAVAFGNTFVEGRSGDLGLNLDLVIDDRYHEVISNTALLRELWRHMQAQDDQNIVFFRTECFNYETSLYQGMGFYKVPSRSTFNVLDLDVANAEHIFGKAAPDRPGRRPGDVSQAANMPG